ncbi:hypothetical protein [Mycobacterium paraffinicum]|uniref:Preprotein translocase subunit YajC n=1 Tax=Mycobacterium paraffinicum TaxID=53378 RepID=A0ABP8EZE2_9MYCO|nr:hypothetical protein [Mycobacterium paraffinicum]
MTEFQHDLVLIVFPVALAILYAQVISLTRRVKRLEQQRDDNR